MTDQPPPVSADRLEQIANRPRSDFQFTEQDFQDGVWLVAEIRRLRAELQAAQGEVQKLREYCDEWKAELQAAQEREKALREALERLVADLETNTEQGAPDYAHEALAAQPTEEATPGVH